jgi:hypothetical protein
MNKRKIKMFVTLYENILVLREDFVDFLSEKLPELYSEHWWERSVVNALPNLKDETIRTFSRFDFSELLDILIYNWRDIVSHKNDFSPVVDRSISLFYKMKEIRNAIAHANDNKLSSGDFRQYIRYLLKFSGVINSNRIDKLNKYISLDSSANKNPLNENEKKEKIIELIETQVISPALTCKKLVDDVKESITRILINLEISHSLEDINVLFADAIMSPKGEYIYDELQKNELKAFENIRKEYNEIYFS